MRINIDDLTSRRAAQECSRDYTRLVRDGVHAENRMGCRVFRFDERGEVGGGKDHAGKAL